MCVEPYRLIASVNLVRRLASFGGSLIRSLAVHHFGKRLINLFLNPSDVLLLHHLHLLVLDLQPSHIPLEPLHLSLEPLVPIACLIECLLILILQLLLPVLSVLGLEAVQLLLSFELVGRLELCANLVTLEFEVGDRLVMLGLELDSNAIEILSFLAIKVLKFNPQCLSVGFRSLELIVIVLQEGLDVLESLCELHVLLVLLVDLVLELHDLLLIEGCLGLLCLELCVETVQRLLLLHLGALQEGGESLGLMSLKDQMMLQV